MSVSAIQNFVMSVSASTSAVWKFVGRVFGTFLIALKFTSKRFSLSISSLEISNGYEMVRENLSEVYFIFISKFLFELIHNETPRPRFYKKWEKWRHFPPQNYIFGHPTPSKSDSDRKLFRFEIYAKRRICWSFSFISSVCTKKSKFWSLIFNY